ncbi:hypothetical protein HY409_01180 [Candidatus Gottesmanbacteria bacterium]|nr:hypothetical protein [Candidatus Gottesmanbacteria bacterium]
MATNRTETLAFVTEDIEAPFTECRALQSIFEIIFASGVTSNHTRILIAGSGKGSDVLAIHNLVSEDVPIVALDCNVPLEHRVLLHLKRRPIIQSPRLLHEYLLQNDDPFSTIILSTGGSHGIVKVEEYKALGRSLTQDRLLICSWDSDLSEDLASEHIGAKQETNLPYYTTLWQKG